MIGARFGPYVVTEALGRGAMGEVWEARHEGLGRRVAIKVLREELARDAEMVERFFNEARAASAIEHAGIVEVLDVGRDEAGRAYLVMEYLDGESLGHRLRRGGPLGVEAAVRIARQIAGALAAVHARGIVHRDLKPDNVFLVRDPDVAGGERAKILDFGIAKLTDPTLRGGVETQTGAVIGTPTYMAPEQCRGAVAVDRRADLYALGCILFEMLAGAPPFVRAGVGDLLAAHIHEPPPTLTVAPAPIAGVVARLLAKSPDDRFGSARELISALDGDAGMASTLGRASAELVSSPTTPRRRRRWWIAAAVLVTAAIAVAGWVILGGGDRASRGTTTAAPDAGPSSLDRALAEERRRGDQIAELRAIAERAAAGGDCVGVERIADEVRTLYPDAAGPFERTAEACRARAVAPDAGVVAPPPLPPKKKTAERLPVRIDRGDIFIEGGWLTAEQIYKVIRANLRGFAECFETASKGDVVRISFRVYATGSVEYAQGDNPSKLESCVESTALELEFPPLPATHGYIGAWTDWRFRITFHSQTSR